MAQQGLGWLVEKQIKARRFDKYVGNTGDIIPIEQCKNDRMKKDRTICTAFAHWTYVPSKQQCLVLDLQGGGGQFTDVEIVTVEESANHFGCGNLGLSSITNFFQQHSCNLLCQLLKISADRPQQRAATAPAD